MKNKIKRVIYASIVYGGFIVWLYQRSSDTTIVEGIELDKILHFSVGFGLSGLLDSFLSLKSHKKIIEYIGTLSTLWEMLEYYSKHFGIAIASEISIYESVKDITSTLAGSVLYYSIRKHKEPNNMEDTI